jgi:hypothetical protein
VVKLQKRNKQSFNEILLSAIDESLSALGENIKTAVFFHLETTYHLKKEQIPSNLEELSDALEQIFGVGARYLEVLFMQQVYLKIKENVNWVEPELAFSEVKFTDYIKVIKDKYEQILVAK